MLTQEKTYGKENVVELAITGANLGYDSGDGATGLHNRQLSVEH